MARISSQQAGNPNRVAYLDLIAFAEIGAANLAASDDGYNVLVGSYPGHLLTFPSYATHPKVFNEAQNSTAAGRYQFLATYWDYYQALLKLPDFSPISQDLWCLQLLKEQKALPAIDAGHVVSAITLTNDIWASLPGSPYGQRTKNSPSTDELLRAFTRAGGTLK